MLRGGAPRPAIGDKLPRKIPAASGPAVRGSWLRVATRCPHRHKPARIRSRRWRVVRRDRWTGYPPGRASGHIELISVSALRRRAVAAVVLLTRKRGLGRMDLVGWSPPVASVSSASRPCRSSRGSGGPSWAGDASRARRPRVPTIQLRTPQAAQPDNWSRQPDNPGGPDPRPNDPKTQEPMDQCTQGPKPRPTHGPKDPWTHGPMDLSTHGPRCMNLVVIIDLRTHGPKDPGTSTTQQPWT